MPETPTRMYKNRDRAGCGPPNSAAMRSTWNSPRRPQFSAPRITTIKVRTLRAFTGRAPGGHAAAVEVKACRPTAVPLRLREWRAREDGIRKPPADRLLCRRSPREPERTGLIHERAEPRARLCAARDQVGPAQRHPRCSFVAGDESVERRPGLRLDGCGRLAPGSGPDIAKGLSSEGRRDPPDVRRCESAQRG